MYQGATIEEIKDQIGQEIKDGWKGKLGEERCVERMSLIDETLEQYSERLNMDKLALLRVFENSRNVNCTNWYQKHNFPNLNDVVIVKDKNDFLKRFPSKKFQCPFCEGETTDPQECNSGLLVKNIKDGKKSVCNWKSYGLFGAMGKGIRMLVIDQFLSGKGKVFEVFRPIEYNI